MRSTSVRTEDLATPEVALHFERLGELRRRGLVLFPIRHHSPACAWHLGRLILAQRPAAVLVEGPSDFDPLVPLLLHSGTVPPVAVYTTWVDRRRGSGKRKPRTSAQAALPPPRFAGYYPLCDYSPELVALRAGVRVGARLRFIDLTFPEQIVARRASIDDETAPRVLSLLEEGHLLTSAYTAELARRLGCRDGDELWDHLFENRFGSTDAEPEVLEREVGAYTLLARLGYDEEALEADGTLARERAMAAAIRDELDRRGDAATPAPIVAVCGGFHAGGLARLLSEETAAPAPLPIGDDPGSIVLTRYGFPQLDALNGYASGMPAPYYYQRAWELLEEGAADPGTGAARDLLVEIARRSRERDLSFPLSAAEAIVAVEQTRRLAWLRRHPTPCRQDLLDAALSCFVKGERDGAAILEVVREVMAGSAVGRVPREAGLPPLVADFRRRCERLGLDLGRTERKRRALDIYRKPRHREMSRLFHSLGFLGSSFAVLVGGPDFRRGTDLDLMQEHWEVGWSPNAEVALLDAAVYGATVEEATLGKLRQTIAELEREGRGRSAAAPVELLVQACRMGLHRHLDALLRLIEEIALEDPDFPSLVDAVDQLALLWQSREPLEAHELEGVPHLAEVCYRRACYLLPQLGAASEEERTAILHGLASLREHLEAASCPFDPELFYRGARRLVLGGDPAPPGRAGTDGAIAGGAAGVLFAAGRLEAEALVRLFAGHLGAALRSSAQGGAKERRTAFLRGLMVTGRESLWRLPALLETLDDVLGGWSAEEFLAALPELRLAFSTLTPRETDRVARLVGALHGGADLGDLAHPPLGEAGLTTNSRITTEVLAALRRDGLEGSAR